MYPCSYRPFSSGIAAGRQAMLRGLAVLALAAAACSANADCDIPSVLTNDRPFSPDEIASSFADESCDAETTAAERVFYRYYSYPLYPDINIGRFFTLDFFTLNSEAIVALALYPFPPNPQFQNFAYFREQVTVVAGIELFVGRAGPQPVGDLGSCYSGGASQYFYAGDNITTNPAIRFSSPEKLTVDTRYRNTYGKGDPCNVIPLPATGLLFALGVPLLLVVTVRHRAA
jgi:hypothetical protein